jgi:hypothetical protein
MAKRVIKNIEFQNKILEVHFYHHKAEADTGTPEAVELEQVFLDGHDLIELLDHKVKDIENEILKSL